MICINFTNCKKVTNRIKVRKVNGAKLKAWLTRAFIESPYKLRFKSKSKRIEFSDTIVKMTKVILVIKVE